MPAPDPLITRALECGESARLIRCSHLAIRVWLHLFYGPESERACVVPCRPFTLADDLDSKPSAITKALAELVGNGLLLHDAEAKIASRPNFLQRHLPPSPNIRLKWLRTIVGSTSCLLAEQAREFIKRTLEPSSQAGSQPSSQPDPQPSSQPRARASESESPRVRESISKTGAIAPTPSAENSFEGKDKEDKDANTSASPAMQAARKKKRDVSTTDQGVTTQTKGKALCTIAEAIEHGAKIGVSADDAEAFWYHHDARDWVSRGTKITVWRSAMQTWRRQGAKFAAANPQPQSKAPADVQRQLANLRTIG